MSATTGPRAARSRTLLRALRLPSAFIGSNWAGLLGVVTIVGSAPALAGVMRVASALDRHADESFVTPLRQLRTTWRRDLPISLLGWVIAVAAVANVWALTQVTSSTRIIVVGVLAPVVWVAVMSASAYVAAAAAHRLTATRTEVMQLAAMLIKQRPVRAWLTPVLLVALAPITWFGPLTIACGLSGPAWLLGQWWGVSQWRRRLDPDPDEAPAPDPSNLQARWRALRAAA